MHAFAASQGINTQRDFHRVYSTHKGIGPRIIRSWVSQSLIDFSEIYFFSKPSSICYSFSVDCYFISSPWIFARVSLCSSTISNISSSASSENFGLPIAAETSSGLFGSPAAALPLACSFDAHDAYHLSAYIGSLPPRHRRYIWVTNAALLQLQLFGWIDDPVITIAPEIVD